MKIFHTAAASQSIHLPGHFTGRQNELRQKSPYGAGQTSTSKSWEWSGTLRDALLAPYPWSNVSAGVWLRANENEISTTLQGHVARKRTRPILLHIATANINKSKLKATTGDLQAGCNYAGVSRQVSWDFSAATDQDEPLALHFHCRLTQTHNDLVTEEQSKFNLHSQNCTQHDRTHLRHICQTLNTAHTITITASQSQFYIIRYHDKAQLSQINACSP